MLKRLPPSLDQGVTTRAIKLSPSRVFAVAYVAACAASFATASFAQDSFGTNYGGSGLQLIIDGSQATILYSGELCTGFFEGRLVINKHGASVIGEECEIAIHVREDGSLDLQQGIGCTTYHGARCSLTGIVMPHR